MTRRIGLARLRPVEPTAKYHQRPTSSLTFDIRQPAIGA
jgi:hypothetical protein